MVDTKRGEQLAEGHVRSLSRLQGSRQGRTGSEDLAAARFSMAFYTGARLQDVANMRWKSVGSAGPTDLLPCRKDTGKTSRNPNARRAARLFAGASRSPASAKAFLFPSLGRQAHQRQVWALHVVSRSIMEESKGLRRRGRARAHRPGAARSTRSPSIASAIVSTRSWPMRALLKKSARSSPAIPLLR